MNASPGRLMQSSVTSGSLKQRPQRPQVELERGDVDGAARAPSPRHSRRASAAGAATTRSS